MESAKILIADDDRDIVDLVAINLAGEGFSCVKAYDGAHAMSLFKEEEVDLAILDIMMPAADGCHVCEWIRKKSNIPIIMLSAKSGENDKVFSLVNGADDYVTKPFNTKELVARVKSQLRRYRNFGLEAQKRADAVELENLWMDRNSHRVKAYGKEVKLTPTEFDILFLLASHPNEVFSTDEIFERVWKEKSFEMSNTVMVHIRRIREKIELDSRNAKIIKTVWGVGYKIEAQHSQKL